MRRRSRKLDQLLAELRNADPEARRRAIEGLTRASFRWVRPPLPSARQIDQIFRALAAALAKDTDPAVRSDAANAIAAWFEPRAAEVLLPVLEDETAPAEMRALAAEGIGNSLDQNRRSALHARATKALLRGLASAEAGVRFWCIFALGVMCATEARPELERLAASDDAVYPGMWGVRDEAADALAFWDTGTWPDRERLES